MEIRIQIDVQNAHEVLEQQKGQMTGFLAGLFLDKKRLKTEVEKKVCAEVVKKLEPKIAEQLSAKGVKATVNFIVKESV